MNHNNNRYINIRCNHRDCNGNICGPHTVKILKNTNQTVQHRCLAFGKTITRTIKRKFNECDNLYCVKFCVQNQNEYYSVETFKQQCKQLRNCSNRPYKNRKIKWYETNLGKFKKNNNFNMERIHEYFRQKTNKHQELMKKQSYNYQSSCDDDDSEDDIPIVVRLNQKKY